MSNDYSKYTIDLDPELVDGLVKQALYEYVTLTHQANIENGAPSDIEFYRAASVMLNYLKVSSEPLPKDVNDVFVKYECPYVNEEQPVKKVTFTGTINGEKLYQADLEDYIKEHFSE